MNKKAVICHNLCKRRIKGIKNKNIKPLSGKPLIAHSIQQALSLKNID